MNMQDWMQKKITKVDYEITYEIDYIHLKREMIIKHHSIHHSRRRSSAYSSAARSISESRYIFLSFSFKREMFRRQSRIHSRNQSPYPVQEMTGSPGFSPLGSQKGSRSSSQAISRSTSPRPPTPRRSETPIERKLSEILAVNSLLLVPNMTLVAEIDEYDHKKAVIL